MPAVVVAAASVLHGEAEFSAVVGVASFGLPAAVANWYVVPDASPVTTTGEPHAAEVCQTGEPPGTLVRLADDRVPVYFSMRISPHQLGLSDVLATLELSGEKPAEVVVLGLVPKSLEMCLELSDVVSEKLDSLVAAVADELARLGYAPTAKT